MSDLLVYLVILIALALGWWLGRRSRSTKMSVDLLPSAAIKSLTDIINQESDIAIDRFVDEFEVNESTFETHMALGNVSRRRGEIEKAIKVHQNLISRPNLSSRLQDEAYFELAKDYLQAGLLDRAENLFQDLVKTDGPFRKQAQFCLLSLYEDEQEWNEAAVIAEALVPKRILRQRTSEEQKILQRMSHYYCEMAQQAIDTRRFEDAINYTDKAQAVSRQSLRSAYLRACIAAMQDDHRGIERVLPILIEPQSKLLFEALWLVNLLLKPKTTEQSIQTIVRLYSQVQSAEILTLLSDYGVEGRRKQLELLDSHIALKPSNRALALWANTSGKKLLPSNLQALFVTVFTRLRDSEKRYRCSNCGFSGKQFYWKCPTCKQWDTVELIRGEHVD